MFCDLVGSTALSARLDPEDLREVIRGYQAVVASVIRQFDGFIARNVSDMLGRPADARNYLAEAAQIIKATDARMYESEVLHRVPGDLLAAAGDQSGAEQKYRQAIAVAERQSAKLDQLRASTSLARLWQGQACGSA